MGVLQNENGQDIDVMGDFRIILDDVAEFCTLNGRVWNDNNQNGIQDAGEDGIPGLILLADNPNFSDSIVTGVNGEYSLIAPADEIFFIWFVPLTF